MVEVGEVEFAAVVRQIDGVHVLQTEATGQKGLGIRELRKRDREKYHVHKSDTDEQSKTRGTQQRQSKTDQEADRDSDRKTHRNHSSIGNTRV